MAAVILMAIFPGGPPVPTTPTTGGLHIDECFTGRIVAMRSRRGHVYAGPLRVEAVKPPRVTMGFTHILVGGEWMPICKPDERGHIRRAGHWTGRPEHLVAVNTKTKPAPGAEGAKPVN